jgi:hypothetical protein
LTARRAVETFILAGASVLALAAGASAQSSGDEPSLESRLRLHGLLMNTPGPTPAPPTEAERYREFLRQHPSPAPPSRSQGIPGYIGPLSTETATGRMGIAGWTSSGTGNLGSPASAPSPAATFGFAVEWGVSRNPAEAP